MIKDSNECPGGFVIAAYLKGQRALPGRGKHLVEAQAGGYFRIQAKAIESSAGKKDRIVCP